MMFLCYYSAGRLFVSGERCRLVCGVVHPVLRKAKSTVDALTTIVAMGT